MNHSPREATSRLSLPIKFMVGWGCFATLILLALAIQHLLDRGFGSTRVDEYFYTDDLKSLHLPAWTGANALPLSPEKALEAAKRFASEKHPNVTYWNPTKIELEPVAEGIWVYSVFLTDGQFNHSMLVNVNILMDGSVWKPSGERRK